MNILLTQQKTVLTNQVIVQLKIKHNNSPRVPKSTLFYQAYTKKKNAYVNIFKVTKNQDCKHSKQKTYFKTVLDLK